MGKLVLKMAGLGALGIGIGALFFLSATYAMIDSPRGTGTVSLAAELKQHPIFGFVEPANLSTSLLRFFSSDLLGSDFDFKGTGNYLEAGIYYTGLLSLLVAPLVFTFLNRRKKILYLVFAMILFLPIFFPWFRYAFWLFTGDYYRAVSFFSGLVLLLFTLESFNHILEWGRVKFTVLLTSYSIMLLLLFYPHSSAEQDLIDTGLRNVIVGLTTIYFALILMLKKPTLRTFSKAGLLLIVCVELAHFSSITVNHRQVVTGEELKQKTGYNDYTVEAVEYINSIDKSFFRTGKDYFSSPVAHKGHAGLNDAKVQGYRGTSSYDSFNQFNYIQFLQGVGIISKDDEWQTRNTPGLFGKPLFQTFASNKYMLRKSHVQKMPGASLHDLLYTEIKKVGDVTVSKIKNYLPLGFTYDRYITSSDFQKLNGVRIPLMLLSACIVPDESTREYSSISPYDLANVPTDAASMSLGTSVMSSVI
jgi:hypothetical protein